jgi:hypothetical protein
MPTTTIESGNLEILNGDLLVSGVITAYTIVTTTANTVMTGSFTGSVTGALQGSSSFATTASAATSITFTPASASYAGTDWLAINNKPTVVSSSLQVSTGSFTGSFIGGHTGSTLGSASFATTASAATSITFVPTSASFAGTDWNNINNKPTVVSSSAQYTTGSYTGSLTGSHTGTFTGSMLGSASFATTASAATSITFVPASASFASTDWFNINNKPTVVSASSQVSYTSISNIPVGIVSSSAQINTGSFTGSFVGTATGSYTGTFVGNGVGLTGVVASATPAGPNKAIQFNNAGATSGSSNLLFDKTVNQIVATGTLSISGSVTASMGLNVNAGRFVVDGTNNITTTSGSAAITGSISISGSLSQGTHDTYIDVIGGTSDPSAPANNILRVYSKKISGRMFPKWIGPSGVDTPFQSALFGNNIAIYAPTQGASVTATFGATWTKGGSAGVISHPPPSASSNTDRAMLDQMKRTRHVNAITTTNQACGIIATAASASQVWRGNATGLGGFFFYTRFGIGHLPIQPTGSYRLFAGLTPGTAEVVISDIVPANTVGLWRPAAESASLNGLYFITKDATTISSQSILGARLTTGSVFDVYIFAKPNDNAIYWRVDDVSASVTLADTGTLQNLPVNTAFLGPQVEISNGTASLGIATVGIDVNRIYLESDH